MVHYIEVRGGVISRSARYHIFKQYLSHDFRLCLVIRMTPQQDLLMVVSLQHGGGSLETDKCQYPPGWVIADMVSVLACCVISNRKTEAGATPKSKFFGLQVFGFNFYRKTSCFGGVTYFIYL